MTFLLGALGVAAAIVGLGVAIYNKLVNLRNRVKNAFSQIDVQLTRRYDLIPNLVESVKGYMKHERDTLEEVIEARNRAFSGLKDAAGDPADAEKIRALAQADKSLSASLGKLFALAEAYPDLKANENMMKLQEELATTENKVAFARQAFNDAVMAYNTGRETFPNTIVAGMFNFDPSEHLEIGTEAAREAPKVSFEM